MVAGMKSPDTNEVHAQVVESTNKATLQDFITGNTMSGNVVYTDEARVYTGLPESIWRLGMG